MNGATVGATLATRPIGPLAVVSLFVALVAFPIAAAQAAAPAVTALAFAPDGASILAASQAGVVELAWPDLATLGRVETTLPHVHDLAFSRDGRLLAVAGGCAAESGEVELWAWPSRTLSRSVATHQDVVYDVAISDDGVTLAAASADHSISIVDIASGATRRVLEGHSRAVTAVEFLDPAGTRLVSAGQDASLRVWSLATCEVERTMPHHTQAINALAVRPAFGDAAAPAMLASASDDRTVRFWQPAIGRLVRFARLPSAALSIAWTVDGAAVAVGSADGRVRLVDAETLAILGERWVDDGWRQAVAVASDRSVVAAGEDGQALRLDLGASSPKSSP